MSVWRAAQAGDGRTYYYHTQTKQTQWTKPDDFDEPEPPAKPAVPAANNTSESGDWAEAVAGDGRKYYYNSKTRETSWEAPAGFAQQQQRATPQTNQIAGPTYVAGGASGFGGRDHGGSDQRMDRQERGHGLPQKPSFDGPRSGHNPWERQEHTGFRGPAAAKPDEPEFSSAEAAESAFFKVLREHNVTPDMRWTDAFRKILRDREARAIKDPKERKLAFERYCHEVRAEEKIKEKERKDRLREEFREMLATHEEVKHHTRWKTARASIEREAVFKAAGDEDEKRSMFEEYIFELKKQHAEREAGRRKAAMQELDAMLKALVVDPETKWSEAQARIMENERFKSEDNFKALHPIDVLSAFDNHMKDLDRVANDAKQSTKRMRARRERRARDDFRALLAEKSREGKIKAGTKWQDFRASIIDDERFRTFIGTPGSTVLEMFWDVVEDNEDKLRSKRGVALDVLESARFEMTSDTTLDEFLSIMREHTSTKGFDEDDLTMIYERLIAKINKRAEKERHEAEQVQKAAVDDLRSLMREVHPPIRLDHSYDDVMQKLAGYREYKHANESARKTAYEKYMRRLKEREEHDRDRDRARRDRDRETNGSSRRGHERDRDDRPRRTRSPEMDAYEADRKRAQADRERHYRTGSFGLGSPSRDRRDDRHGGRLDRYEAYSHYDRERRDREMERERSYVSRADPRDQTKALNYGDDDVVGSRPGSVRKRQDSDASFDSKRGSKVSS
jgi:pre-mRNA-processing factor 40